MNKNLSKKYIYEVESYINRSGSSVIRVQEIAHAIGINPSDLVRLFHRVKGVSPKKYLDNKLKAEILQSLRDGNIMGYELCYKFGFSSEQAFYRWIKRVFGVGVKELALQITKEEKKII